MAEAALVSDFNEVTALLGSAGLTTVGVSDHFPVGYFVVRQGESIVGVAGLEVYGTYGLLRSVAVDAECRDQGLGRQLVERQLWAAGRMGLHRVYLLTTTAGDYFRELGFAVVPRESAPPVIQASKEFAGVCPASALLLVKDPLASRSQPPSAIPPRPSPPRK